MSGWSQDDAEEWLGEVRVEDERDVECPASINDLLTQGYKDGQWTEKDVVPVGKKVKKADEDLWIGIVGDCAKEQSVEVSGGDKIRFVADTVARRDREETGTSEDEIDIYFGWHERILLKAMQVHYAAFSIIQRMAKAVITGGM